MEKALQWVIGKLPRRIQDIYWRYESMWLYIFFGGLTTVVSIIFQMLPTILLRQSGLPAWLLTLIATTVSWIAAVTFAFFTNKRYVFKSVTHTRAAFWREFLMFYGARGVTYFLEVAIMELGNHFFATVDGQIVAWRSMLVKIAAQVIILIVNYVFSKLVIFRKKE